MGIHRKNSPHGGVRRAIDLLRRPTDAMTVRPQPLLCGGPITQGLIREIVARAESVDYDYPAAK